MRVKSCYVMRASCLPIAWTSQREFSVVVNVSDRVHVWKQLLFTVISWNKLTLALWHNISGYLQKYVACPIILKHRTPVFCRKLLLLLQPSPLTSLRPHGDSHTLWVNTRTHARTHTHTHTRFSVLIRPWVTRPHPAVWEHCLGIY